MPVNDSKSDSNVSVTAIVIPTTAESPLSVKRLKSSVLNDCPSIIEVLVIVATARFNSSFAVPCHAEPSALKALTVPVYMRSDIVIDAFLRSFHIMRSNTWEQVYFGYSKAGS